MFRKKITIGNSIISENSKTFIIAEAGVNHNGSIKIAKQLIDLASFAGADAIKFQAFKTNNLIKKNAPKAPYQINNMKDKNKEQYRMLKKLELSKADNIKLYKYCKKKNIIFITTPYDLDSLSEIKKIGIDTIKIASTDLNNLSFIEQIAKTKMNLILSTGMSTFNEINQAVKVIKKFNSKLIILQCTANYPIKDNEAGIKIINLFKKRYKCLIGYSDHSSGIGAGPYAVALGAKVVEKHFTLNKSMSGPDHKASLDKKEIVKFIKEIRKVEDYLSLKNKVVTKSEIKNKLFLQKYIVANKKIKKGDIFKKKNITTKRTGGKGISAINFFKILGKKSNNSYDIEDIILK